MTFPVTVPVSVRLVDGPSEHEGRLEVEYNGEWGTVCDYNFGRTEADVACHQLGYNGSAAVYTHGGGSGRVWMREVNCNGMETSLDQCYRRGWAVHYGYPCGHSRDVGIICAVNDICKYQYYS